MTPNVQAAVDLQAQKGVTSKQQLPPHQAGASFFETFWSKVYSYDLPNQVADTVIHTGQDVKAARDNVVQAAKKGIDLGLNFGPIVLIGLVGLYVLSYLPRGK